MSNGLSKQLEISLMMLFLAPEAVAFYWTHQSSCRVTWRTAANVSCQRELRVAGCDAIDACGFHVIYEFLGGSWPGEHSRQIIIKAGNPTCAAPDEEAEYT
jgi:hypothetical protein